ILRHHADHKTILSVHPYGFSNDLAIRIKSARPQTITQDHFSWPTRPIFVCDNVASQEWRDTKSRKQTCRNAQSIQRFGWSGRIACQIEEGVAVNSNRLETVSPPDDLLRIAPEDEIGLSLFGVCEERKIRAEFDELFRLYVWERINEYRL